MNTGDRPGDELVAALFNIVLSSVIRKKELIQKILKNCSLCGVIDDNAV